MRISHLLPMPLLIAPFLPGCGPKTDAAKSSAEGDVKNQIVQTEEQQKQHAKQARVQANAAWFRKNKILLSVTLSNLTVERHVSRSPDMSTFIAESDIVRDQRTNFSVGASDADVLAQTLNKMRADGSLDTCLATNGLFRRDRDRLVEKATVPLLTFKGHIKNSTDKEIDSIILEVTIQNSEAHDTAVYTERLAIPVSVFPTTAQPLDTPLQVPGSKLPRCTDQLNKWSWNYTIFTAIPAGDNLTPDDFDALYGL